MTQSKPFNFRSFGGAGFDAPIGGRLANYSDDTGWASFGYDAVNHRGNRKRFVGRTTSEDMELRDLGRRQLTTSVRDLVRNFTIPGFILRVHLDNTTNFHFRSKTGDKAFDRDVNQFMAWWGRPENCDSAGRHSLKDQMRLWGAHATIDGDILVNRVKTGKLQGIEGERIMSMGGIPFGQLGITDPSWVQNGVYTNEYGRALGYMVFRRPPNWTSLQFDRMIPARFADMLGYYSRIDQVRGISPFASAANTFRDLYEGFDYALLKAKATQFLGIKLKRKGSDPLELGQGERRPEVDTTTGQPLRGDYSGMRFDKGPQVIDMDDGDDMEILESQQPSTQFQAFCQIMTMVAMKALDVPFSWFDESHTNFSGSRMAGIRYEGSAKIKRERLRLLLDKTTAWRLGLAIADDEIKLPSKMQPHDMRWQWSHPGMPLFDPLKEISAKIARINAGLSSPQRECEEDGSDFEGNIDERESAEQYAHDHNVIISTALPAVTLDDPANQQTQTVDANEAQNQEDEDEKNRAKAHKALWGN